MAEKAKVEEGEPKSPARNVFQMVEGRSGRAAVAAFGVISLWYLLAHTAVFARLCAELLRAYLAGGALTAVLVLLPLLAGLVYLRKGQRFRVRGGRYLELVLSVLCAGFVWFAAPRAPIGLFRNGAAYSERLSAVFPRIDPGRGELVPALSLLFAFLLVAAGGICCVRTAYDYLYGVCAELYRSREKGMPERAWLRGDRHTDDMPEKARLLEDGRTDGMPEKAQLHEGKRTDGMPEKAQLHGDESTEGMVRLYGRLTGIMFAGARLRGDGHADGMPEKAQLHRDRRTDGMPVRLYGKLTGVMGEARIGWWVVLVSVYALAVGFADAFAAITFYRTYNMQILLPVLLTAAAVLFGIARGKERQVTPSEVREESREHARIGG